MKAAILYGRDKVVIEDRPVPEPKDDEVLVRIKAASICGTDLHFFRGELATDGPRVLGHDFSGVVEGVGKSVSKFVVGDRVTSEIMRYCGKCYHCRSGNYHLCVDNTFMGFEIDGAFQEYVAIPEKNVFKIPDNTSFEEAAILEPVTVSLHAMDFIQPKLGERVAVFGQGPIGLVYDQIAALQGLEVIGIDIREDRLGLAKELGVKCTINPLKENVRDRIIRITDDVGVDYSVEAVGTQATIDQASKVIRSGGKMIIIGEGKDLRGPPLRLDDISVFTIFNGGSRKHATALNLVSQGKVNVRKLLTHTIELTQLPAIMQKLCREEMQAVKVVINL